MQGTTAWYLLTLTFEFELCDMVELISQPAAEGVALVPLPLSDLQSLRFI